MSYKIAAVQVLDIQADLPASLQVITEAMRQADAKGVDVLCFPECFLQGYTLDRTETAKRAMDFGSTEFKNILSALQNYNTTAVIGIIEKDIHGLYNSAAVVSKGQLLGVYRKVHLFESNFEPGEVYPTFSINGLPFGVNICYDARFTEGADELAEKGAKVIFYPLNNRLSHDKALKYRDRHILNLQARAKDSSCWVVSSDVIGKDDTHTGYGCTTIVDPKGQVVRQMQELQTGMITFEIP